MAKDRRASITLLLGSLLLLSIAPSARGYPRPGRVERVSVASDGSEAHPGPSLPGQFDPTGAAISPNGRYVAFASIQKDLVPDDRNGIADVFVHDRRTDITELVSVASDGSQGVGVCGQADAEGGVIQIGSGFPSISANARYVAFSSCATNLVSGDTNLNKDVFVHDRKTGNTSRVSVSSKERQAVCSEAHICNVASPQSISADGRYVAFTSWADNLVSGDTNEYMDTFVRDRRTGTTTRVSLSSGGDQQMGSYWGCYQIFGDAAISASGRFVAFKSSGWNLVPGPPADNNQEHFYVHDRKTGKTQMVDVSDHGDQAEWSGLFRAVGSCQGPVGISSSGRHVVFATAAYNLVPNDANDAFDVFVRDRISGETRRVSVSGAGEEARALLPLLSPFVSGTWGLAISPDGRYASFRSEAADLTPQPNEAPWQVYVHDLWSGATEQLSVGYNGEGARGSSMLPAVSRRGRAIAFVSSAADLVRGDTNETYDIFVRERADALGVGSLGALKGFVVAGDTRFPTTGITSFGDPGNDGSLDAGSAGAELTRATIAVRPRFDDLFVRIEVTAIPGPRLGSDAVTLAGDPRVMYGLRFRVAGTVYELRAQRSRPGTGRASFGLFRCDVGDPCAHVRDVDGGYGTTGEEVVFAVPLSTVGLRSGGRLARLEAYTAYGTYELGPLKILDRASPSSRAEA